MKRFLILLLVISNNIFSQSNIEFGVKGGLNYASIERENIAIGKFGFNLGFLTKYKLDNNIFILGEILYNEKTDDSNIRISGSEFSDYKFELGYIDFPITFNYHVSEKIILGIGPQIGLLVKNDIIHTKVISGRPSDVTINNSEINTINYALNFNLYYQKRRYFIQAGYSYGLTEIIKESKFKSQVISLSFGYIFN